MSANVIGRKFDGQRGVLLKNTKISPNVQAAGKDINSQKKLKTISNKVQPTPTTHNQYASEGIPEGRELLFHLLKPLHTMLSSSA